MLTRKPIMISKLIQYCLAKKDPRPLGGFVFAFAFLVSCSGATVQEPTQAVAGRTSCVIAANDGPNGFRTDEISGCRINTSNGNATFVIGGKNRSRSYTSVQPLEARHIEAAAFWRNRAGQLRVPAASNPKGFDAQFFLQQASRATDGFVLVRRKGSGGLALNVVYITDGVYRSIDFPGTNLRETPAGFLTTR